VGLSCLTKKLEFLSHRGVILLPQLVHCRPIEIVDGICLLFANWKVFVWQGERKKSVRGEAGRGEVNA
jgi:hypothetical protein